VATSARYRHVLAIVDDTDDDLAGLDQCG
jgi:hypothetical protein